MKKFVIPALAIAALAGSALGQGMTTDQVRLELRLVSQQGTPGGVGGVTSFDVAQHPDTSSGLGVARRFEVQFRLVDLNAGDAFNPVGLVSGNLRIVATGGTLDRALLSRQEARNPTSGAPSLPAADVPVNLGTDNFIAAGNGAQGLHAPLRGGIPAPAPNNTNPANGIIENGGALIRGITPLALSPTGQYMPDDPDGGWYGLYSFNFIPTAGSGSVTISMDADATSGNKFGFHTDGDPVPVTSPVATTDTATILVPAPGAFALLGLGGLVAGRRRRA